MLQRISRTNGRRAAMLVAACGACLLLAFWPRDALAQRAGIADDDQRLLSDIFLTPRYETRRRLTQATALLEQRRYGEAVSLLDRLLTQGEDYFLVSAARPAKTGESPPRLKSEALRLIGQMPREGLQWYELQYGAAARALLQQAQQQGDVRALRGAASRYFHTTAGYEATLLLARRHLDRDRPLAAAMCFQRLIASPARARYEPALSVSLASALLRGGHHDDLAEKALRDVKKNFPNAKLELAGRQIAWFAAEDDPLTWLKTSLGPQQRRRDKAQGEWTLFGGDPSRNAASRGGAPLRSWRWKIPTSASPVVARRIEQLQRAYVDRRYIALPSFHPLAVGDTVLMRTASHLVAVDLKTGKRLWPRQPALEIATGESYGGNSVFSRGGTSQFMQNLDRRMWNDAIYGRLASDGRLLFAVRKLAPLSDRQIPRIGIDAAGRRIILPQGPRTYNRLDAFELATEGKLKWSVGGPPNGDKEKDAKRLAGAFFLGAPLPLEGRLYVLAEMAAKREIRLLVLDAETGKLLWSQQLAMAEWSVLRDPTRRAAGASPSYSDGLLICPTTAGAVVAVDLSTRRLKWGYRYPRNPRSQYTNVGRVNALEQGSSDDDVGDGWADSSATLADGYVLVTPADNYTSRARSGEIHCLNLIDGKRIWKRGRNKALYLACVAGGKVILVGRGAVTALAIKDGTPHADWPKTGATLPKGARASGRGFFSAGHYYLPLTTGEIAKIDLSDGKITERIRLRDGFVPGNLICYRDQIISQGADTLAVFHQLDASRRWVEEKLKDHPNDASALLRRGRILLEENKFDEAVADLRASLAHAADSEEVRQLLVEAMLAKLTDDFDQGTPPPQEFIGRLRSLIETPEERVALLRHLAVGLAKTGKRIEAFETLLQLVDRDDRSAEDATLEPIEPSLVVRRDRWIRAALGQVRSGADADERKVMEAAVAGRLPKTDAADLPRFIEHFADFDATDTVRRALVDRLAGLATLARRERLLRRLERSADPAQRRAAVAAMAALLVEGRRPDEAAGFYARLGSDPQLADAVCRDGKTGREIVNALAKDSPVRRYLGSSGVWPRGAVTHDAARMTGIRQPSLTRSYRLKIRGDGGPFFTETTTHLDPSDRTLTARDAHGNQRWRLSLRAESLRTRYGSPMVALDSYCAARGHLLLFSSRNSIYAIDTLRASAQNDAGSNSSDELPPAVLWRHERNEQIAGVAVGQGYSGGLSFGRYYGSMRANRRVSALGPVTDAGVCFQRVRELVCVDPLTGYTQWVRRGMPKDCELFGDEELLFVIPPNSETAQVLRAADGKLLGERDVPPKHEWITTVGRHLLTKMITDDGTLVIDMIDPWKEENRERWPLLNFAAGSQFTLIDRDALAVLEPDGHFVIHSLDDRRTLVEAHLETEAAVDEVLQAIYVIPSRDRYLLLVDRPVRPDTGSPRVTAAPSHRDVNLKMINARMYAFDRAGGKPLWPAPARIDRYALLLHQPRELPVLVVGRQVKFSNSSTKSELLCLDKRSGRLVYRSPPLSKPIANYTIAGDPSQRAVSLVIQSGEKPITARISFSDEPTAPDPPYQGNQSGGPPNKPAKKFKGAGDDPFSEEGSDNPFSDEAPEDDD